jgi:hypothetical protein
MEHLVDLNLAAMIDETHFRNRFIKELTQDRSRPHFSEWPPPNLAVTGGVKRKNNNCKVSKIEQTCIC